MTDDRPELDTSPLDINGLADPSGGAAADRGPIAWMAANPVAANLLMLLFLIGGWLAIPSLRQEVFPEFDLDLVRISVVYPGASPAEVEQGVLLSIEERVREVDGVKRVTSVASEGVGVINAELFDGVNPNRVVQDVQNAVARIVTFPEEAERPVVSLALARREVLSLVLYGDVGEHVLRDLAEMAKDELTQDPKITLVELDGIRPLEIAVEVPLERLRAHGLTLGGIADALTRASVEIAGGGVKTPDGEVLVRAAERRERGADFARTVLLDRPDGTRVRLGDIARVTDGFADTELSLQYNGKPAVALNVYRVGKENPVETSRIVTAYAERLRERLPPSVKVAVWNDRSELYRDRIRLLLRNAAMGLVLVMIVLGLFLEVRLAFWVMMGIPVSFLGSLLVLPQTNVSINMISLFAFIIALGIVVDDAIVIGESIFYFRRRGRTYLDAARRGARAVAVPVIFSVLTNMASFVPLLFVPGTMGKIWRNVPVVIIAVFSISLIEALFILPAHLAHQRRKLRGLFWRVVEAPQERFGRGLERFVERRYRPFLGRLLRHRYLTVSVGLAALILCFGWLAGGRIKFFFFPRVESDIVRASIELPYGAPVEETRRIAMHVSDIAREIVAENGGDRIVRGQLVRIGGGDSFGASIAVGGGGGGHQASVTLYLVPINERPISAARFIEEWRRRAGPLPGVKSATFRFTIGPSSGSAIDVRLTHPDLDVLETCAAEVAQALRRFDGVVEIDDGIRKGKPQLDLRTRPAALSLGLTPMELGRQVRHAFYGAEVRRHQRGRNELRISVRLPEEERRSEANIRRLIIRARDGGELPLGEAAEIRRGRAYQSIRRADGRRILDVTADVIEGVAQPPRVLAELERTVLADLQVRHPGLGYSFEGENRDMRESLASLRGGFVLALLALFAMLAIPFKSYLQALIVLIAIPFGIVGAVLGHLLLGYELSIISLMGMVALSGVVINDSLLLVDTANEYRRNGLSLREAIALAPVRRFRPVLLTSLTTFFGLMPIILEKSLQARFMIPMAISLGFGILFSTTITLMLVPALYTIIEDVRELFRGRFSTLPANEESTEA